MEHLALSLAVVGAAILALPFLDPKDDRARIALFGICILLIWRYLWWRFETTLPALEWRFDSLYAWGFSIAEAIAILGWTVGFITLSRTRSRSIDATQQSAWLDRMETLPRVDVLITTYNEDESILARSIVGALGIDFPGVRVWVCDDGQRPWLPPSLPPPSAPGYCCRVPSVSKPCSSRHRPRLVRGSSRPVQD